MAKRDEHATRPPGEPAHGERRSWRQRLGRALARVALLTVPSLLLLLLLFEVLARLVLPVSDVPDVRFDDELGNHFVADQRGVYVKGPRSEIRARYRINDDGWNAERDCVPAASFPGETIAVIGDSFVEAFQVDVDANFAARLEKSLDRSTAGGPAVQVCPFGHSGANLFQYLKVLEHVMRLYHPAKVILNVVPNDYAESLEGYARRDNWSLRDRGDRFEPVPPQPTGNLPLKRALRHFATVRYLTVNLDLVTRLYVVRQLFYGNARQVTAHVDSASLDVLDDAAFRDRLLRDLLGRAVAATRPAGTELGLILEVDHDPIYEDRPAADSAVNELVASTERVAAELGVPTLDLDTVFRPAWQRDHEKFEFEVDGHWNGYAHGLVAAAAQAWLTTWDVPAHGDAASSTVEQATANGPRPVL